MDALYVATATAVGGRQGRIKSDDGVLDTALAHPKELGGPGGHATNPEQLFAAGYAACFENALLRVARESGKPLKESSVTAKVGLNRAADGFSRLQAELLVSAPGRDRAEIEAYANTAHAEVCPYSRATRGNMDVTVSVVDPA